MARGCGPRKNHISMNELDPKPDSVAGEMNEQASAAEAVAETENSETRDPELSTKNYHLMSRDELVASLREIVASGDMEAHREVAAIKQAYYLMQNRDQLDAMSKFVEAGNEASQFQATPDAFEEELKQLFATFRERRAEHLEKKEAERMANLEKKNAIIESLRAIAEDIDNVNVRFAEFQQLQNDFKAVGEVPPGSDNDLWKNYQATVEQFYDRLKLNKELRDLDFRKNLEVKLSLLEKARKLGEHEDPIEAFRKLQDLHEQWRQTGPVAKERREEIWNDFKEASTVINKRHQDYFAERKAEEAANEERKTAIVEKVEAMDLADLKGNADWDARTKEIIELQKEYKEIGFAPRKANAQLFARFRKACDTFFTAKAERFKKLKEDSKENLAKKTELCERAEALLEGAEEKGTLEKLQALQQEWRTVGAVRGHQGDEIWKRFCAAVDAFHAARRKFFGAQRSAETENLKAKQGVIAELRDIPETSDRRDVIGRIRELQDKWQQIGFVPFKNKEAVNQEYRKELNRLFEAFDKRESSNRMRRFEGEVKKMGGDGNKLGRERDRLVRALEARQAELKTIENNLGFFNIKSNAGNSMLKEFERKIARIKDDIAQIQSKISLLEKEG